ncbi:ATP-binding protein [Streptomyces sp. H27-C3]|uniref:ATP-binding protein n=1 Tax=Streptomyces sp. H27-C3 TaxID=3046305 RepID=UPI0024BB02D7|nr:ATP-binding protein [Streptomyces sp. H27-C3]MDJ0466409.1 ATP-binding protein [Streptomyces sp. H27-C3]
MNSTTTTSTAAPAALVIEDDSPAGVPRARDVARAFARSLDPALEAETAETLALVVSELATNALRHGGGRYTLQLGATTEAVHVAVSDPSSSAPRERTPDLNGGAGGFGWHMIRHLTSDVTTVPGPGQGKTVHARLTRCPAEMESTATASLTATVRSH